MKITRARRIEGEIRLPGDKSISHRAAMLAAIADGRTSIQNYAASADCASTLDCLAKLGVEIDRKGDDVTIGGVGKYGLKPATADLDCGNSGTTMRLISGILAGQTFPSTLMGDDSLSGRPMRRIIGPLTEMGAAIDAVDGHAPLTITGRRPLKAIEYIPPVASAQIKSCVLIAGIYSDAETAVIESTPTRDHTERMLEWFGVRVGKQQTAAGQRITVNGGSMLAAREYIVPGDISAAAFFMVAAACLPGSDVTMQNVGINSTRSAICDLLRDLGVDIEVTETREACNEPVADIRVREGLAAADSPAMISGKTIANLIDEIPVIAVLGTQLASGLEIRDAAELRVKETDRIAAVCTNLRAMGAGVTEYNDGFRVERSELTGATIDSFGDHRIAMAFAVAGLLADGDTQILRAECAAVSFPAFFDTLAGVVR